MDAEPVIVGEENTASAPFLASGSACPGSITSDESKSQNYPSKALARLSPGGGGGGGRRGRVALACRRCKRRKQRCDGLHPVCSSCSRSTSECIYERIPRPKYPGGKSLYISALEERIAFLEARMPEFGQDHLGQYGVGVTNPALLPTHPKSPSTSSVNRKQGDLNSELPLRRRLSKKLYQSNIGIDLDDDGEMECDEWEEPEDNERLVDRVAFLSLCACGTSDSAPEPFYLGSSSGTAIARLIPSTIYARKKEVKSHNQVYSYEDMETSQTLEEIRLGNSSPTMPASAHEFPTGTLAETLLFKVFFDRLHTHWPVLNRKLYHSLFEKGQLGQQVGALSMVRRSIVHLIFAIAARFLQLVKKPCGVDPSTHFSASVEPMKYILEQHNLETVQFLVLLSLYGQRAPYGSGSWSQIRYATTLCIEMGMHREKPRKDGARAAADAETSRRTFWACYCMDRMITITLGRTFAIADHDINIEVSLCI